MNICGRFGPWAPPWFPTPSPRLGAGHDQGQTGLSHVSASYLRERLLEEPGETSLAPHLSPQAEARLRANPASLAFCTQGVLARLRGMEAEDFSQLPDSGEGLSHRLYDAVQSADSLPALYQLVKTKRYPLARIRRLVLWAFLGLTAQDRLDAPPYLRVLGFTAKGQNLLRQMKTTATLPVIVKPAHGAKLPSEARRVFCPGSPLHRAVRSLPQRVRAGSREK